MESVAEARRTGPAVRVQLASPWITRTQRYGIFVILAGITISAAVLVNGFGTVSNLANVLRSVSLVGIVAIGMTFIVISGNFVDLSVPSQVAGSSIVVLAVGGNLPVAIAAALATAGAIGLLNGTFIGAFRANPVLVTLGVQTAAAGAILAATGGSYVYGSSEALGAFGKSTIGPLPVQGVVFLAVLVGCQFLLARTRFGAQVVAVGANRSVARASGIPVQRVVAYTFALSSLLAGLCGILLAALTDTVNSSVGTGFEFDALTAVVIAGTSLFGGSGSLWRTLAGVLLIGVVNNVMVLVGLPFASQLFVKGCVIIAAVALDALARRHGDLQ